MFRCQTSNFDWYTYKIRLYTSMPSHRFKPVSRLHVQRDNYTARISPSILCLRLLGLLYIYRSASAPACVFLPARPFWGGGTLGEWRAWGNENLLLLRAFARAALFLWCFRGGWRRSLTPRREIILAEIQNEIERVKLHPSLLGFFGCKHVNLRGAVSFYPPHHSHILRVCRFHSQRSCFHDARQQLRHGNTAQFCYGAELGIQLHIPPEGEQALFCSMSMRHADNLTTQQCRCKEKEQQYPRHCMKRGILYRPLSSTVAYIRHVEKRSAVQLTGVYTQCE